MASESAASNAGPPEERLAVALHHEAGPAAPVVIASGRGHLADKILELAFAHGVRVRQDPDLAQVLAAVELESRIPPEAFVAVAEILAYVYRANQAAGTPPSPETPDPAVSGDVTL